MKNDWISLNDTLDFLVSEGFELKDVKEKLPNAIERCMVRARGIFPDKTETEQEPVLFGWLWDTGNIDWENGFSAVYINSRYTEEYNALLMLDSDEERATLADIQISKRDLKVWSRLEDFEPQINCWPNTTSIDALQLLSLHYAASPSSLMDDMNELHSETVADERKKEILSILTKKIVNVSDLLKTPAITVYSKKYKAEEFEIIEEPKPTELVAQISAAVDAVLLNETGVRTELRFNIAEAVESHFYKSKYSLEFTERERKELEEVARNSNLELPMLRRLSAHEAVNSIAFHDIEGGALALRFANVYSRPRYEELMKNAAQIIQDAASVGKLKVLGIEKTNPEDGHRLIEQAEWLRLFLEDFAIFDASMSFLYGAETGEIDGFIRKTQFIDLRFNSEELLALSRELYETKVEFSRDIESHQSDEDFYVSLFKQGMDQTRNVRAQTRERVLRSVKGYGSSVRQSPKLRKNVHLSRAAEAGEYTSNGIENTLNRYLVDSWADLVAKRFAGD